MATNLTATQDPKLKNNLYYGGTVNLGGATGLASKPITPELKAFNEQMVAGNKNVINTQNLQDVKTVPLAPVPDKTSDYTSYINQVSSDLNNQVTQAQMQEQALREQAKNEYSGIAELQKTLSGKDEALTKEYETQGVRNLYNQLADLNVQAQGLQRESQAIPIQIQEEFKGRGATEAGVAPIQASRLRENALKALSLGQQSAVLSAQYDKAKNYADMIVEAKYKKIQGEIDAKLTNLSSLKEFGLTPAQEKLRQAQERQLSAEKEQNDIKKTKEKAFNDIIIQASSQNAPVSLLDKAKATQDPTQAAMILGQYAGDYYKTELLKQQIATEKAQRAKIYDSMKPETPAQLGAVAGNVVNNIDEVLKNVKLDAGTKTNLTNVLGVINSIKEVARINPTGNLPGVYPLSGYTPNVTKSSEALKNRGFIDAVNLKVQQWASGASLTKEQIEQVNKLVPQTTDFDKTAVSKMNSLVDFMEQQVKTSLQVNGIDYKPATVNLFQGEQKKEQTQNLFSQSLGKTQAVSGTKYIDNIGEDGSINFTLPSTSTPKIK